MIVRNLLERAVKFLGVDGLEALVADLGLTDLADGQPLEFTLVDRGGRISATNLRIEGEPMAVERSGGLGLSPHDAEGIDVAGGVNRFPHHLFRTGVVRR